MQADNFLPGWTTFQSIPSCGRAVTLTSVEHWYRVDIGELEIDYEHRMWISLLRPTENRPESFTRYTSLVYRKGFFMQQPLCNKVYETLWLYTLYGKCHKKGPSAGKCKLNGFIRHRLVLPKQDWLTLKIQELNSRTEAPFPIFNSNIFQFGKSSNMA